MSTQPKWQVEFDELWADAGLPYPNRKSRIKHFIKQLEHQTILRCVEEIKSPTSELNSILENLLDGFIDQAKAKEQIANKLQDLSNNT